jgi:hypothetical protein
MYFTYTGQQVSPTSGAPSLEDIAWQLLHVCRYAGACRVNYTVGIHSMLVADLAPKDLEFQALLHDGTEACVGDIPKPFKSDGMRKIEDILIDRIWEQFGLLPMKPEEYKLIKEADIAALSAEADLIGPPGLIADGIKHGWYKHNSDNVDRLKYYLSKYKVHAWGIGNGDEAQWDFLARARQCLDRHKRVERPYMNTQPLMYGRHGSAENIVYEVSAEKKHS